MSYGQLQFLPDSQHWVLRDPAPHVAITFKRLFERADKRQADRIFLKETRETPADLLWFMERYPLDVVADDRARLDQGRAAWRDQGAAVSAILSRDWTPPPATGFREGCAPYLYQAQAAEIAKRTGRLMLMDDVGLGKTFSAMTALATGAPLPAAVVVDAHLAEQWEQDFIQPNTHLRTHIIKGTQPYDLPDADVYIFRYSNIGGWTDVFRKGVFRSVVYDEVQSLRTGRGTGKGAAAARLSAAADLTMGLTATPIYNYGSEIWNVFDFVAPDILGSLGEFQREWCSLGRKVRDPDALGAYLYDSGAALRRTETDVQDERPPLNTLDYELPFDAQEFADVEAAARALAGKVLSGAFMEAGRAARELDIMMRMVTGVAKARAAAAYARMIAEDAGKVLLVGWHRDVYDIWLRDLADLSPVLYTGSESPAAKRRNKQAFVEGGARVMILSLRSGAGLDGLQRVCSDVIFGELDWSPQVHKQVIGRLRRPGQKGQVSAHYLHCDGGSDPLVMEMLGIKADQARGIVDPGTAPLAKQADDSRIRRLAERVIGGKS